MNEEAVAKKKKLTPLIIILVLKTGPQESHKQPVSNFTDVLAVQGQQLDWTLACSMSSERAL